MKKTARGTLTAKTSRPHRLFKNNDELGLEDRQLLRTGLWTSLMNRRSDCLGNKRNPTAYRSFNFKRMTTISPQTYEFFSKTSTANISTVLLLITQINTSNFNLRWISFNEIEELGKKIAIKEERADYRKGEIKPLTIIGKKSTYLMPNRYSSPGHSNPSLIMKGPISLKPGFTNFLCSCFRCGYNNRI